MQRLSMPNVLKTEDDEDNDDEEWTYEYVTDSGEEWDDYEEIKDENTKVEEKKEEKIDLKKTEDKKKEEMKKNEEMKKKEEMKKMEEKKKEETKRQEEKKKVEETAKKSKIDKKDEPKKIQEKGPSTKKDVKPPIPPTKPTEKPKTLNKPSTPVTSKKASSTTEKKSLSPEKTNKSAEVAKTEKTSTPKKASAPTPPPKPTARTEQTKKEDKKLETSRSVSPTKKGVLKTSEKEKDTHKSRQNEENDHKPRRSTVEQLTKEDEKRASTKRGSSVVKIKEPEEIEKSKNNRKTAPRSHSLIGSDDPRNSLSQVTTSAKNNRGKSSSPFRSVSPVKSVNERRKAFINPEAPQLVINNVPRGNLLARFVKNPPKPPSPPPKKQFKWALPTTSKATESTYWKPPQKPQPYKSSAPEHKENPLIIEPILFPEEQKIYEEEKQKEEEVKKPKEEKKGEKKGKEIKENKQKVEDKNIKNKKEEVKKPEKKQIEKKEVSKKPLDTKKKEKETEKKELKKENTPKVKDEKNLKEKVKEKDEKKEKEEDKEEENEKEKAVEDEQENVEDEEMSVELDEEEEIEDENKENEEEEPKKKKRKHKKSKKPKKIKTEKPKRKWVPPPRPPPEAIEMPPEEKHLWEIGRDEVRHGNRPSKMYAKREKADSIDLPYVLPWELCPALQSQTGMCAFGTQRDPKTKVDQGHIELVQGALKPETVLPLFEESERTIAAQNELVSFGAHRKNVGKIVDNHEYVSNDKLHLSEGVIPRHMLGSLQSHDLDPIWGNLRSQTTKVWQPDGTRTELQCAPDSNTIIGRQFAPANPENRAGNNIIDRRRLTIQQIEGVGELKPSRLSECIVPKIFSTDFICLKSGADFGAFRPTKMESVGGHGMSFDDEKLCKLVIPFQTAPSLR